jgi:PAS domain-containing protein
MTAVRGSAFDRVRRLASGAAEAVRAALGREPLAPSAALPPDCHGIWIDRDGVVAASRGARDLIGPAARANEPLDGVAAALGIDEPGLVEAFRRLALEGAGFRRRARARDGRVWEIAGGPSGARCLVTLREASAEAAREEAAARMLAAARAEADALRAALGASAVRAWRIDAAGRETWRSAAAASAEGAPPEALRVPAPDGGAFVVEAQGDPTGSAAALRRFIEAVSDTFANLRAGLAIFGADRRLTLSNPALAEIFHVDPGWLATRPTLREVLDRLREARQLPEQADYPAWRAALFTLFEERDRAPYEDQWEMPDGRAIHVVGRPHQSGGIAFVFEDVSAALSLQRESAIAREVQRSTLDVVRDGVAVFGLDGRARVANAAFHAIWGLPRQDGPARHIGEIAAACGPLTGPSDLWQRVRAAVAGGEGRAPWAGVVALTDGRTLDARLAPMRDGSTLVAFTETPDAPAGLTDGAGRATRAAGRGGR